MLLFQLTKSIQTDHEEITLIFIGENFPLSANFLYRRWICFHSLWESSQKKRISRITTAVSIFLGWLSGSISSLIVFTNSFLANEKLRIFISCNRPQIITVKSITIRTRGYLDLFWQLLHNYRRIQRILVVIGLRSQYRVDHLNNYLLQSISQKLNSFSSIPVFMYSREPLY